MSDHEALSRPGCDRYADDLAELALGILTGRERALALAHVEGCPACHAEMERLSLAADALLEMVPAVEPPLGFEVRLMERLGEISGTPRVARGWRRLRQPSHLLAGLLLLVAVGAGLGGGWLARGGQHPSARRSAFGTAPGGRLESEPLVAGGRTLGNVAVYSGSSGHASWLFMTLDDGSWSGEATCQVRLADGATLPLGTFWLEKGYGAWGVTLPSGTGAIRSASVVSYQGVLGSAQFPSSSRLPASAGETATSGPSWMMR
jgi:hypothetical protein